MKTLWHATAMWAAVPVSIVEYFLKHAAVTASGLWFAPPPKKHVVSNIAL